MFTVFADKLVIFEFICTGFAEHRLWQCCVCSFKHARTLQQSRVFPFTFAYSLRKSNVLQVCLCILVSLFAYAVHDGAGSS